MRIPSRQTFETLIEERRADGYRYDRPLMVSLDKPEGTINMRLQGGYITRCALQPITSPGVPSAHLLREILYTPPQLDVPKLNASHVMSPVGPFDGLGGQHGFARWVDYAEIKHRQPGSHDYLTEVPEDHPLIARSFDLFDHSAYITTTLDNCTETPRETSLGEHLYFALTDENANGLRIGTSEATMAEPVKLAEIMRGESQFWPDYQGFALVDFPDGKRVQIKSSVFIDAEAGDTVLKEIEPSAVNIGMLLWHRLGTESICLEPTIGYSDDGRGMVRSDLLKVAAGHAVQLETELTLLAPSMTTVHLPE